MPRIGSASLNTVEYWDGVYGQKAYPTLDYNNTQRYKAAADMQLGTTALDIGCGQAGLGLILLATQSNGFFYCGCDFSKQALESHMLPEDWKDRWSLIHCSWEGIRPSWRFGTVYLCEMLEHLDDPSKLLAMAADMADHRIVLTVPMFQVLSPAEHRGEHAWDFTLDELKQLAKPHGELSEPAQAGSLCWAMYISLNGGIE